MQDILLTALGDGFSCKAAWVAGEISDRVLVDG
jgi:hypothetical protein